MTDQPDPRIKDLVHELCAALRTTDAPPIMGTILTGNLIIVGPEPVVQEIIDHLLGVDVDD